MIKVSRTFYVNIFLFCFWRRIQRKPLPRKQCFLQCRIYRNFSKQVLLRKQGLKISKAGRKALVRKLVLQNGKAITVSPWRSYFKEDSKECAESWFISLGPLGLETLMHDRSWGVFKGQQQIFPMFLCDGNELIFNNFEVKKVKPGSPTEGKVFAGDHILAIDSQALLSAQNTYIGQEVDNRSKRGLEIHAGQLIDAAESRGYTTLSILRLSPAQKKRVQIIIKR